MDKLVKSFETHKPLVDSRAFVANSALVLGNVRLGTDVNIWYGAILRGDVNYIEIGARTNLQDRVVVHVNTDTYATIVGEDVTVGHGAILHGCTVRSRVLVGMGAILLDGAVVQERSVVAAGSVVPPGKEYPPDSLIMGSPARVVRRIDPREVEDIVCSAKEYVALALRHCTEGTEGAKKTDWDVLGDTSSI